MDLIDRQAAIDEWKNDFKGYVNALNIPRDDYKGIMEYIDELPSAQSDIVRCKDCKYYAIWELKSDYTSDKRFRPSVCIIGQYAVHRNADYYCADGERKDNENET